MSKCAYHTCKHHNTAYSRNCTRFSRINDCPNHLVHIPLPKKEEEKEEEQKNTCTLLFDFCCKDMENIHSSEDIYVEDKEAVLNLCGDNKIVYYCPFCAAKLITK